MFGFGSILFSIFLSVVLCESGPEIAVAQGRLKGLFKVTKNGRKFSAFEGIPFAEPPLKHLRFKAPVPVKSWEGVKDATSPHNICPQRDIYRRSSLIEGDEDCLYLNVYTPQLEQSTETYPVMIFFHGGGWLCGGGNSFWYGPEILLDRDVVLVVTNYRLGALGFLSTGDEVVPGNNGMKDQQLAMKWVQENIHIFGGDNSKISIFGESAGGASVQLHMVSPLSKGLFHTGISQSGTAHCLWAVSPNDQAIRHARMLAKELNCSIENNNEMIECLQKVPAYDIIAKDVIFMKWDLDPMIPFKPVIEPKLDGAFLTEHPIDIVKSGNFEQIPWIVGLNSDDGALRAAGIFGNPHLIDELEENFDEFAPISLLYDETTTKKDHITKQIRTFYFGDDKINKTSRGDVVDMYTDAWFLSCADEAIRHYLRHSQKPVYYYLFEHRGPSSFTEIFGDKHNDYGVCHADDLQYLFPVGDGLFPDRPHTEDDKKVAKILTTLWANFAKTSNPTPSTDELIPNVWHPVSNEEEMEYYHIETSGAVMKKGLFKNRTELWRSFPIRTSEIKDEL